MIHDPNSADLRRATDAFFQRYGRPGAADPLVRLTDLARNFGCLPYENFTKIIQLEKNGPTPRPPLSVVEQHLDLGTGGTCFALTELFCQLCARAGLQAHPVMAHMRHGPNIHCGLLVHHGQRAFLLDPGYQVHRPLALPTGRDLPDAHGPAEPFLVPAGSLGPLPAGLPTGQFDLFTLEPDGPRWRYRFSAEDPGPRRFAAHWRRSFFASGLNGLFATRRTPDGTLNYLHNHKLRSQQQAGRRTHNIRRDLEQQVAQTFGIDPAITAQARSLVQEKHKQFQKVKQERSERLHVTPR